MKKVRIVLFCGGVALIIFTLGWLLVPSRNSGAAAPPSAAHDPTEAPPHTGAQTGHQPAGSPASIHGGKPDDAPLASRSISGLKLASLAESESIHTIEDLDRYSWEQLAQDLAHKDPRILTAKVMLGRGEYDDAIAMLDEIISGEPDDNVRALAHLMKGIALSAKGETGEALAEFETIIANYPNSAAAVEAVNRFGQHHFQLGTILDAMEWAMAVLEADPTNSAAWKAKWELVVRAARRGERLEVEELWQVCMDGVKSGGQPVDVYQAGLALAKSLPRFDRWKMFQLFEEIVRYCPDPTISAEARIELVERYATLDPAQAIRLGQEVLDSSADEFLKKQARRNMVNAYMAEGDIETARQLFEEVLSDGWTDPNLCYHLSRAIVSANLNDTDDEALHLWLVDLSAREGMLGDYASTLRSFLENPAQQSSQSIPSNWITLTHLGKALLATGNYDLVEQFGISAMEEAEKRGGDLGDYMNAVDLLAAAMAARGDYGAAADMMRVGIDRFHDDERIAEWVIPVADYLKMDGRYDEALAEYERIAKDLSQSIAAPRALYLIGETYRTDLQDNAAAGEAYQRLISAYPDSLYADEAKKRLESLAGT